MQSKTETVTVAVQTTTTGVFSKETREGYPTCHPLLKITPTTVCYEDGLGPTPIGLWNVTHTPTGWAVLEYIESVERARLLAGVLSGWPLDWSADMTKVPTAEMRKRVGEELYYWFRGLRTDGRLAFEAALARLDEESSATQ